MRIVIILAIIAILLGGLSYYMLFHDAAIEMPEERSERQSASEGETMEEDPDEFTGTSGTGSLQELRALGEDIECTITYQPQDGNAEVEGTYFVSNGNLRGDFLTETPDLSGQMLSSMILRDGTMYVWSEIEGETYGIKMDVSAVDDEAADQNKPVPLDETVTYDCSPWSEVDRTIFEPPQDVRFQSLSEMMQGGMEYGTIYEEGQMMPQ